MLALAIGDTGIPLITPPLSGGTPAAISGAMPPAIDAYGYAIGAFVMSGLACGWNIPCQRPQKRCMPLYMRDPQLLAGGAYAPPFGNRGVPPPATPTFHRDRPIPLIIPLIEFFTPPHIPPIHLIFHIPNRFFKCSASRPLCHCRYWPPLSTKTVASNKTFFIAHIVVSKEVHARAFTFFDPHPRRRPRRTGSDSMPRRCFTFIMFSSVIMVRQS